MITITGRNVNHVYQRCLMVVRGDGERQQSRAGEVLVVPHPVMVETLSPQERVLFDPSRDANPFFHLFESLHMLAGRRDYTWLDRFVKDFSARFGEEDGNGHGAYGYRWRHQFGFDQLKVVEDRLRRDPKDRRVVIQMWDADEDLGGDYKDIPCNTHIYPRIVYGRLDLTVCCRSNDVVWGLTGANAVHFSMLQEYLAGRLDVEVGVLYQLANNFHAYTDVLDKVMRPWETNIDNHGVNAYSLGVKPEPIGTDWARWDEDLRVFMDDPEEPYTYYNPWFWETAGRMWITHSLWKAHRWEEARQTAELISAPDWRRAVIEWMLRREFKKNGP